MATAKSKSKKAETPAEIVKPTTEPTKVKSSPKRAVKASESGFQKARRASILLKHLSDATRLQVILLLNEGEKHVGALCEELHQSQPAVSHHLALLRHGSVIAPRRQGKNNYYSLTESGRMLAAVVKMIAEKSA